MKQRRDIFQAIADPTRRGILSMLLKEPQNVNTIAEKFEMTRQGISLHVKILDECDVITISQQGRERICSLKSERFTEIRDWLEPFQKLWEKRFDELDNLLENLEEEKNE